MAGPTPGPHPHKAGVLLQNHSLSPAFGHSGPVKWVVWQPHFLNGSMEAHKVPHWVLEVFCGEAQIRVLHKEGLSPNLRSVAGGS